jgi:DNA-binding NarL/FixJ family response regulator
MSAPQNTLALAAAGGDAGAHAPTERPAPAPLRVLIADSDPLARRMIRHALNETRAVEVVGDAADRAGALELARSHRPDVLVLEPSIAGEDPVDLIRGVARAAPETRTVLLCAQRDDDLALDALSAGAVGYVTKDLPPGHLVRLVRRVAQGDAIVPPSLMPRVLERLRATPDAGWRPVRSRLTSREWEIVDLIAEGVTTNSIAKRLVLSPATVYSHVKSLMRKLDVHSRRDAVTAAERLRREEAGVPTGEA